LTPPLPYGRVGALVQLRLITDIRQCLTAARRDGRAAFSVLGVSGPEVRCNVRWHSVKGFLLVLSWLNGEEPAETDALGLVTLFATCVRPEGGLDGLKMLRNEYEGAPGSKPMWHRTYVLPMPAELADTQPPLRAADASPGRNDPCSCGSGRKFKKCHGSN